MKNVVMLSVILAVVSVPRYLYAAVPIFSRNYGCLVDNWTGGDQRFYYCGNQNFDCGAEKHNRNDYSVCNNGSEVKKKNGACFLTDGTKFTTRSGDTFYCCNGTSATMGTIQKTACQPPETPVTGGGSGSGTDGFWSGSGTGGRGDGGSGSLRPDDGGDDGGDGGGDGDDGGDDGGDGDGQNEELIKQIIEQSAKIKKIVSDIKKEPDAQYDPETCPDGIRYGNNPKTGACIECAIGKYYNSKDEKNGYCSYAIGLTKTDMMYGYGKTQNSNPRLRNQCWTIKDIVRYRACVLSGVQKPTTIKVPIQSAMDTAVANTVSEK